MVTLESGDWLIIFTDGLVEAMNRTGEEYGENRILSVLNAGTSATPDEMLRRLMSDLDAFVGETAQHDDVTCMLVKAA
jgi:sigma-B regulation protein RsbU (phosphoserine phosphatase)